MTEKLTFEEFNNRTEFARTLAPVESFVKWRYVSMHYFKRSPTWMTLKLVGKDGNGGKSDFTSEEKAILKGALVDMADTLRRVADAIVVE